MSARVIQIISCDMCGVELRKEDDLLYGHVRHIAIPKGWDRLIVDKKAHWKTYVYGCPDCLRDYHAAMAEYRAAYQKHFADTWWKTNGMKWAAWERSGVKMPAHPLDRIRGEAIKLQKAEGERQIAATELREQASCANAPT